MRAAEREALEEGGPDLHPRDRRREAGPVEQEGVHDGVGEELAEHLEYLLPAAHPVQPVVDKGDVHATDLLRQPRRLADPLRIPALIRVHSIGLCTIISNSSMWSLL